MVENLVYWRRVSGDCKRIFETIILELKSANPQIHNNYRMHFPINKQNLQFKLTGYFVSACAIV